MSGLVTVTWTSGPGLLTEATCVEIPLRIKETSWQRGAPWCIQVADQPDSWGWMPDQPEFAGHRDAKRHVEENLLDLIALLPRDRIEPRFLLRYDLQSTADELHAEIDRHHRNGWTVPTELLTARANALAALAGLI